MSDAPIRSHPATTEYRENHERTFGERQPGQRGRWVWDARQGKLVRADEYQPEPQALNAPILTDRFMEGHRTLEGEDIGSRRKRLEYMKRNGLVDANDFSNAYFERQRAAKERETKAERKQAVVEAYKQHGGRF